MCTVTFLPDNKGQFLLTSNRDEAPHRSPQNISNYDIAGQRLAFPRDEEAGGTWIVIADSDRLVCILNGAFVKHHRQASYRRSRGLMALDFFSFPNFQSFASAYEFNRMEPFTMIVVERGVLMELRWDETQKHIRQLSIKEAHIWSSSTLYTPEVQAKREQWFKEWLEQYKEDYTRANILDFHRRAGDGDSWNDVVMNRNNIVRTVSITSVKRSEHSLDMQYNDLMSQSTKNTKIAIKGEMVRSHQA